MRNGTGKDGKPIKVGDFVTWELNLEPMQVTGIMDRGDGVEYYCTMVDGGPVERIFRLCEISLKPTTKMGFCATEVPSDE